MKSFIYELLNKLNIGIIIIDEDFRIVHVNYWLAKRIECDPSYIINSRLDQIAPKFQLDSYKNIVLEVLKTGRGRFLSGAIHKSFFISPEENELEHPFQNLQIERLCIEGKHVIMMQVHDVSKENYKVIQLKHFIRKLEVENNLIRQSEEKNRQMAYYDALSQIPNRAYFLEHLNGCIDKSEKEHMPLGLLFIDLDRLKRINDTYGHRVGDAVIVEFSKRLVENLSESDFVARLSGDEFAILVTQFSKDSDLKNMANRIVLSIGQTMVIENLSLNITCSVGITVFKSGSDTQDVFIERADKALYLSKNNGRNQFHMV